MEGSGNERNGWGTDMGGVPPKFRGGGFARNPLLPYAYLWGNGDISTRLLASVFAEKKVLRVAVCPPPIHFSFPSSSAPFLQTRMKHNYTLPFSN